MRKLGTVVLLCTRSTPEVGGWGGGKQLRRVRAMRKQVAHDSLRTGLWRS